MNREEFDDQFRTEEQLLDSAKAALGRLVVLARYLQRNGREDIAIRIATNVEIITRVLQALHPEQPDDPGDNGKV